MPKRPRARATPALPSRDDILAYLKRESERGAAIGKREIARAFAVKGADRIGLKALLKDMEAQGLLDRRRKAISGAGALPATLVAVIFGSTPDGDLVATPADWNVEAQGAAPRILIHLPRRAKTGEAAPGPRDNVLLHIEKSRAERDFPYVGRVIRVIPQERSRARSASCACKRTDRRGSCRSTRRHKGASSRLPRATSASARDGDLVSVALLDNRGGRRGLARAQGLPRAKVRERLGSLGSEKAVSLIALYAHAIPHVVLARGARRSRARSAGKPRRPGGLAATRPRHHRSARRQGP